VLEPDLLRPLLLAALCAYGLALALALFREPQGRGVLLAGVGAHLAWTVWRGVLIGYLPMTNKTESFSAAALALAVVALLTWTSVRSYLAPLLALALGSGIAAAAFPAELREPGGLLRTIWYLLHVPLSFFGLAVFLAAAAASLAWVTTKDRAWLNRVDRFALQGLGLWTAAMTFGGVWGVVAWGAAFMWDPKLIWSVLLWFHYSAFVHVRLTPSLQARGWVRPALAGLGVGWILVAYVGTSFFFGRSAHAF